MLGLLILSLGGCISADIDYGPMSSRRLPGPASYTVDWDLPETGLFWVPKSTENDLKRAADGCNVALDTFLYYHYPRPPQYSYIGFRFFPGTSDIQKSCLVKAVGAVPALTVYPKKK